MLMSCAVAGAATRLKITPTPAATVARRTHRPIADGFKVCLADGRASLPSPVRGCRRDSLVPPAFAPWLQTLIRWVPAAARGFPGRPMSQVAGAGLAPAFGAPWLWRAFEARPPNGVPSRPDFVRRRIRMAPRQGWAEGLVWVPASTPHVAQIVAARVALAQEVAFAEDAAGVTVQLFPVAKVHARVRMQAPRADPRHVPGARRASGIRFLPTTAQAHLGPTDVAGETDPWEALEGPVRVAAATGSPRQPVHCAAAVPGRPASAPARCRVMLR